MKTIKKIIFLILFISIILFLYLINNQNKTEGENIILEAGEHYFEKGLIIDQNEILTINPGATLLMGENSRLEINGKIISKGTKDNPITFKSSGDYFWKGIKINGKNKELDLDKYWNFFNGKIKNQDISTENIFDYCYFLDTSNKENVWKTENKWIGTVEGFNTSLSVSNSIFNNIKYIGAIVTQGTFSIIKDNTFLDNDIHKQINNTFGSVSIIYRNTIKAERNENQTCADGLWINDSVAIVYGNTVMGVGDDGIDSSHSRMIVVNNKVTATQDEGIDIDDVGIAIIFNNSIDTVRQNGILVSEKSKAFVKNNIIINADNGFTLRNGATAIISDIDISNSNYGIAYYNSIPCLINEEDFSTIKDYIIQIDKEDCSFNGSMSDIYISYLEDGYDKKGEYYIYNKDVYNKQIDDALWLYNIFGIDIVKDPLIEFCNKNILNKLYVSNVTLQNNKEDYFDFNNYNNVMNYDYDCEDEYLCELNSDDAVIQKIINNIEEIINVIDNNI